MTENQIKIDYSTFSSISKNDSRVAQNKVLQHMFENEKHLNCEHGEKQKSNNAKVDGTLVEDELRDFVKHIDTNDDDTITSQEIEEWKSANLAVNKNAAHKNFKFEDIENLFTLLKTSEQGSTEEEAGSASSTVKGADEYANGKFVADTDDKGGSKGGEFDAKAQADKMQKEYEELIANFPNLKDNIDKLDKIHLFGNEEQFSQESGFTLDFIKSIAGYYSPDQNMIAIKNLDDETNEDVFAHEIGHFADYNSSQKEGDLYTNIFSESQRYTTLIKQDLDNMPQDTIISGIYAELYEQASASLSYDTSDKSINSKGKTGLHESFAEISKFILSGTEEEKEGAKKLFPMTYMLVEAYLTSI